MTLFTSMRRLYERGPCCRGLAVDREGVALGPHVTLVQRVNLGYRCVGASEMTKLMRAVFAASARLDRLSAVLADIADALERGDLVKAQLLAMCMPIGVLDDEQLVRLAAVGDLIKAGFDPNQPRDDRGRWSDDGAAQTMQKAGARSKLPTPAKGAAMRAVSCLLLIRNLEFRPSESRSICPR